MNRLLIIDGHNLLFQMFFGMPSRIPNANGKDIRGVVGFIGAVNKLANAYQPSHLIVMFDGEKENPRKAILEEYKANRIDYSTVPDEENPFTQLPYIYDALDYMGIKHSETTNCETDDVIAAYALRYGKDNEVFISSFDSDYFQLIDDNVKVIRYRGTSSLLCDSAYINEKYGISPKLYLDWKCMVGDTSDNIPGIRGIGPKTAVKLLNNFGNIETIQKRSAEITSEKIRTAIDEGGKIIERNRSLIKLCADATLPFTLEEAVFTNPYLRTMEILHGIGQ